MLRLLQVIGRDGDRLVACSMDGDEWRLVKGVDSVRQLAGIAIEASEGLTVVAANRIGETINVIEAMEEDRLLPPIDHPDPAHIYLTGTGLTHLGSAEGRDQMHAGSAQGLTDSMRMFQLGVEGGKPVEGEVGCQPEWFYKGNGRCLVGPGGDLIRPSFALDGSEEAEIAGIYLIDPAGRPRRLGWALANEFSDHITERSNYLYLAHSKLRPAALGPELLVGRLPNELHGMSRIHRNGSVLWEKPFLTGEANMSHSFANLEYHHFKYELFRQPGDLHVHFFGTATLSFTDGVQTEEGDLFEIKAAPFALPLRNRLVNGSGSAWSVGEL